MASVRDIVQAAEARLSLPIDQVIFGSDSDNALQLASFVNEAGVDLARGHPWVALQQRVTFTTVANARQPDVLPAGTQRIVPGTVWNETQRVRLMDGIGLRDWGARVASVVVTVTDACRVVGRDMYISPAPAAGETISFWAVSEYWVSGEKSKCTQDDDVPLLDAELLILSTVARWRLAKGLEAAADVAKFEAARRLATGRDNNPGARFATHVESANDVSGDYHVEV